MKKDVEKLRKEKLLDAIIEQAADRLNDTLLETCADQEYRICLLELGINQQED